MPIYEYRCNDCNNRFEYLVLGSDKDICCPECNGEKVERIMSACSFKSSGDGGVSSAGSGGCSGCTSSSCASCH